MVSIHSDNSTSVVPLTKCRVPADQEGTGRDLKSDDRCIVEWADKKTYAAQIDSVGLGALIYSYTYEVQLISACFKGSRKAMNDLLHAMEDSEEVQGLCAHISFIILK